MPVNVNKYFLPYVRKTHDVIAMFATELHLQDFLNIDNFFHLPDCAADCFEAKIHLLMELQQYTEIVFFKLQYTEYFVGNKSGL